MLEGVPVNDQGEETDMDLHPDGEGMVAIRPYPFRRDALSFSIMARRPQANLLRRPGLPDGLGCFSVFSAEVYAQSAPYSRIVPSRISLEPPR
jgi:hypothetical protein